MERFDDDGGDVVEGQETDAVAGGVDLGVGFDEDVSAGATALGAFGAEEHGDGAEVGGEVAGSAVLFGALGLGGGALVAVFAELGYCGGVCGGGGQAEAFV